MSTALVDRLRSALVDIAPERPETVEALRPLYDPDVEFRDPIQTLRGLDPFLAMNRRLLGRARELSFDVTSAGGSDEEIFIVWTMRATPKIGPRIAVEGITQAKMRRGLVVYHRDFWDLGELFASAVPGGHAALRILLKPLA
jgi:hypothetical protein